MITKFLHHAFAFPRYGFRRLSTSPLRSAPAQITRLTVLGTGTMGEGISEVAIGKGVKVVIYDINEGQLERAVAKIQKAFPDKVDNLSSAMEMGEALRDAELVIEAVPERLAIKHAVFREADKAARPDCLFASNTSSMAIKTIAECCSLERRKLFGGMHFFTPVQKAQLVEVARTKETTDEAFETLLAFGQRMRDFALPCSDAPGLVINRIVIPVMLEAFKIIGRKQTNAADLDQALRVFGWPPVRIHSRLLSFADEVGLDVYQDIIEGAEPLAGKDLVPREWGERIPILEKMIAKGRMGTKTGKGWYDYVDGKRQ